jgi:uncharacterized protein (TIGR02271 family)
MTQPLDENNLARLVDAHVRDAAGREAIVTAIEERDDGPQAWVQLADGMQVLVPVSLFRREGESYRLPFRFEGEGARFVIPVLAESVQMDKRSIDTGRGVRVHKRVSEEQRVVDEALLRDELVVERVPVGTVIADGNAPQARQEGDTWIVPVLEEVLVVQKQLLLKEEVRITRRREEVHAPQTVRLRSEHVEVERFDEKGTSH